MYTNENPVSVTGRESADELRAIRRDAVRERRRQRASVLIGVILPAANSRENPTRGEQTARIAS